MASDEKLRFGMVKRRHAETFGKALRQGKVDEQMQPLCSFIAGTKNFFTSSCCSGRIMLLEKKGGKKKDNFFHRKWHRPVSAGELREALAEETSGDLWFKTEPFILHVGCAGLSGAEKILGCMKRAGVKRGGIIVAEKGKFLVELQGTERMEFPVKVGGEMVALTGFVVKALETANPLLEKNYERLAKLEKEFRKSLE
ncbi:MAG TPA: hypothetical protein VFF09_04465 [archaeon]|nr:hypothetical protein [archaeon]